MRSLYLILNIHIMLKTFRTTSLGPMQHSSALVCPRVLDFESLLLSVLEWQQPACSSSVRSILPPEHLEVNQPYLVFDVVCVLQVCLKYSRGRWNGVPVRCFALPGLIDVFLSSQTTSLLAFNARHIIPDWVYSQGVWRGLITEFPSRWRWGDGFVHGIHHGPPFQLFPRISGSRGFHSTRNAKGYCMQVFLSPFQTGTSLV